MKPVATFSNIVTLCVNCFLSNIGCFYKYFDLRDGLLLKVDESLLLRIMIR